MGTIKIEILTPEKKLLQLWRALALRLHCNYYYYGKFFEKMRPKVRK